MEAKLEQGDALDTAATFGETDDDEGAEVIDLLEALQRSVEKRKGSDASGADEESSGSTRSRSSKAAASKTAAADEESTATRTRAAKKPATS